jgi:hypothetical protein
MRDADVCSYSEARFNTPERTLNILVEWKPLTLIKASTSIRLKQRKCG